MPFGPGLSCSAPSPGGAGARPLRASIPIAGAPPASRRFAGRLVACRHGVAWVRCATARGDGALGRVRSPAFAAQLVAEEVGRARA